MAKNDDNVVLLFNKTPEDWKALFRNFFRSGGAVVLLVALVLVVMTANPFYKVEAGEQGVVLRFGKHVRTAMPGLRFKLPWPIESVYIVDINAVNVIPIGYRNTDPASGFFNTGLDSSGRTRQLVESEALMLTGDENIIHVELDIQYRISDPVAYLFNVKDQEDAILDIGEATLRRVIGDYSVDAPLTEGKSEIEIDILTHTQELVDRMGLGVEILTVNLVEVQPPSQVQDAFKDVISAKENKQEVINRAKGYENGEIPRAEGMAAALINEASGYYQERVLKSKGEIQQYSALLSEYRKSKEVTRFRLYLETMEQVLGSVNFTLVDKNLSGLLPLLHLGEGGAPLNNPGPAANPSPTGGGGQ